MRPFVKKPAMFTRFLRARKGSAAVEFALILPVMLLVYIGTMEASALISMDRKVQSVASSMGDLVSRTNTSLTRAQMRDFFSAASGIMTPYDASKVRQVVTAISVSSSGEAKVAWSREYVGGASDYTVGTQYPRDSAYPLPQAMIDIAKGHMVIAAEATYSYTPLYGIVFDQPVNLYRSGFYLPRFGGIITVP
ncbi:TadE-like protein [Devosia equisanguinis]|uniref:TadE-like protein n=1 Tax=Devosia equisanguinis TaxID=2490941 RepID=A0A3S4GFU8_9HYPH|nr:TadE/TadG family type IV pilus assembly protein [Devosia equisanguinis]VDS03593.1 TadE-like protein [Devosia equisanguinis]